MDLSNSIAPKSDQLDAEDLLGGPRVVTVAAVRRGPSAEQPVNIYLEEFDRPWRPAKTVRRILVAAWGADASNYTGRQLRIYRDPEVRFGGMAVGGIRVSHLSHIDQSLTLALTVARGRRAPHVIEPFPDAARSKPEAGSVGASPQDRRSSESPTSDDRPPETHDSSASPMASEAGAPAPAAPAPVSDPPPTAEAGAVDPQPAPASAPSVEEQQAEIRHLSEERRRMSVAPEIEPPPDDEPVVDTRPKKISPGQRAEIIRQFTKLKVDELPMRLTYLATLTGRDQLDNPNELTFQQAVDVITTLQSCTNRDDLEALANGQGSLT